MHCGWPGRDVRPWLDLSRALREEVPRRGAGWPAGQDDGWWSPALTGRALCAPRGGRVSFQLWGGIVQTKVYASNVGHQSHVAGGREGPAVARPT